MAKKSAGVLVFRTRPGQVEVLLVHPGGPFWAQKDDGAWSIPKGEFDVGEDPLAAARREFQEETGFTIDAEFVPLQPLRQPSGKIVFAWAVKGDFDPALLKSNSFSIEWPPKSGHTQAFPEVDRAAWFSVDAAKRKILRGQAAFIDQLLVVVGSLPHNDEVTPQGDARSGQGSLFEE
jgi:predicted NUDIX family NTP pyrophosphohydrolase